MTTINDHCKSAYILRPYGDRSQTEAVLLQRCQLFWGWGWQCSSQHSAMKSPVHCGNPKDGQVYTYSIPGVFAQGTKKCTIVLFELFIIIICLIFCAYTQILRRDVEDFCVHAQKFQLMISENNVFQHWLFLRIYANPY